MCSWPPPESAGFSPTAPTRSSSCWKTWTCRTASFGPRTRRASRNLCFWEVRASIPKMSPQPIKEEYLLSGPLEPTNDAYAIAKIAGIKLCQAYHARVWGALHLRHAHEPVRTGR